MSLNNATTALPRDAAHDTPVDKLAPTDIDGEPIVWAGNPAHLEGVLHEAALFYERHGLFQPLLHEGGVLLSNGKLAVDSLNSVSFVAGTVSDPYTRGFSNPCPPTPTRIAEFNTAAAATGSSAFAGITAMPSGLGDSYVVSKYAVAAEDQLLVKSLSYMIKDSDKAQDLINDCRGSGRELISLLRAEALKATAQDRALVLSQNNRFVVTGLAGEVNLVSFNAHYKQFKRMQRNLPPASRMRDDEIMEMIHGIMFKDASLRSLYEIKLQVSPPSNLAASLELVRQMLRSREVADELISPGSNANLGSLQALVSAAVAAGDLQRAQALLADPAKNGSAFNPSGPIGPAAGIDGKDKQPAKVKPPRDKTGRIIRWIPGMDNCTCGGKHLMRDCPKKATDADKKTDKESSSGKGKQTSLIVEQDAISNDAALAAQLNAFFNDATPSFVQSGTALVAELQHDDSGDRPPVDTTPDATPPTEPTPSPSPSTQSRIVAAFEHAASFYERHHIAIFTILLASLVCVTAIAFAGVSLVPSANAPDALSMQPPLSREPHVDHHALAAVSWTPSRLDLRTTPQRT